MEYIIIDGGSTDDSVEIIRKYEPWLSYWISEPDKGQSHAINKGFKKAKGIWGNWICSDDMLCKNALNLLAPQLPIRSRIYIVGKGFRINQKSQIIDEVKSSQIINFEDLTDIKKHWRAGHSIFQPGVLFLIEEFKGCNCLNEDNHYTMDMNCGENCLFQGMKSFILRYRSVCSGGTKVKKPQGMRRLQEV